MNVKKKDHLFTQLIRIAENMAATAKEFYEFHSGKEENNTKAYADRIKELESAGDTIVHETIVDLNRAFITPIEHEDILRLAELMDEVVDGMEECASYFYLYDIKTDDSYIAEFKKNIAAAAAELQEAVQLLADKKMDAIHDHTVRVKTYEEACDHIEREAIHTLIRTGQADLIRFIEMKDIYQLLERTADACQDVAKALDMVVMKNL